MEEPSRQKRQSSFHMFLLLGFTHKKLLICSRAFHRKINNISSGFPMGQMRPGEIVEALVFAKWTYKIKRLQGSFISIINSFCNVTPCTVQYNIVLQWFPVKRQFPSLPVSQYNLQPKIMCPQLTPSLLTPHWLPPNQATKTRLPHPCQPQLSTAGACRVCCSLWQIVDFIMTLYVTLCIRSPGPARWWVHSYPPPESLRSLSPPVYNHDQVIWHVWKGCPPTVTL